MGKRKGSKKEQNRIKRARYLYMYYFCLLQQLELP